jgi:transposase
MDQWVGSQRAFAVKSFYKNGDSATAAQREFRRHYNLGRHARVPTSHAINTWVKNFEETGSALKKKPPGGHRTQRTPENIEAVRASIGRSPQRSARKHASALNLNRTTIRRILHSDLKFHPYKIQVVQELKPLDYVARQRFCEQMIEKINDDPDFVDNFFMSDEAHFHISGYVNKQNCRYWGPENPRQLHERPLHSQKVTVWCAVSTRGVIGPYFFEDERGNATTVTSQRYVDMLNTFVAEQLQNFPDLHNPWFQQDGATAHTARASMMAVRQLFGNHVISRFGDIHWPPRSPDLSVCDFFLWGHLKSKVYTTRPTTILELKTRIREEIAAIPMEVLQRAMQNLGNRFQECIRSNGHHLMDIVFRN